MTAQVMVSFLKFKLIKFLQLINFEANLKQPLDDAVASLPKVRIMRSPFRIGLMKARMLGAVNSQGPALIFMDAHIEVRPGWLEPLLDRLRVNKNITAIASVDNINPDHLGHFSIAIDQIYVQGFNWDLIFTWKAQSAAERNRRKTLEDPIYTPTMLGAFFVIDKEYFELLGMYDEGLKRFLKRVSY